MESYSPFIRNAVLLLVTLLLIGECECLCSRRYSLQEPDCSTATLNNGQSAVTKIPCRVRLSDGHLQQLEFPKENAQTCYRTCIDRDNYRCEATLVSNVHNRDLPILASGSDYELRLFSQGFQRTTNRKYRKSSICRYNIACDKNKLLTYSIQTHILEDPANCGDTQACIDSLTLQLPGMAARETTCGTINDPTIHSDGSTELTMEFTSNRKNELTGFMVIAWCVDPGASPRQTRGVDSNRDINWRENCTSPRPMWKRDGHEWEETSNNTVDPALLKLAAAFPNHDNKILASTSIHITVDVFGHVSYANNTIAVSQPSGELTEFPGITSFHLSNRLVNDTVFKLSAPGRYHGYGYVVMWRWEAFFLQDGVNPEYRTTDEERAIIMQLQTGLKAAVSENPDEGSGWEPTANWTAAETPSLVDIARLYSTACNALLRSTACAYLQVVANENCEQSNTAHKMSWSDPPPTTH